MRINLMQTQATAPRPTVRQSGPDDPIARRRKARRGKSAGALVAALAVTGALAGTELARENGSVRAVPAPGQAWPGELTAGERAAVTASLRSPDARTHRIAIAVAAGEAGSLALADPSALHHHGLDATPAREGDGEKGAEGFHHR
jgi:hypothetical protein